MKHKTRKANFCPLDERHTEVCCVSAKYVCGLTMWMLDVVLTGTYKYYIYTNIILESAGCVSFFTNIVRSLQPEIYHVFQSISLEYDKNSFRAV